MEKIYPPHQWRASEKLDLKSYFDDFNSILPTIPDGTNDLNKIRNLMQDDVSQTDLAEISAICSVTNLICEGEDTEHFPCELPDQVNSRYQLVGTYITSEEPNNLQVIKYKRELEKKRSISELTFGNKRKHHQEIPFPLIEGPTNLSPGSDYILHVTIYKPFAYKYFLQRNTSDHLRFSHEILALGQNSLTDLRDAIVCPSDTGLCKEVENTDADLTVLSDAKKTYPSGFIFINDVFYNDFRAENSIDYSAPIIKWAKDKQIAEFPTKEMKDVQLSSLRPRMGYPYVYMHQGDCEHLLVFSDAKLLQQGDCLHSQCYPHVFKSNRSANIICRLCCIAFAKWMCMGSDRFPHEKAFLCTQCCNSYLYIDGKKISSFKLYPYYEKHVATS